MDVKERIAKQVRAAFEHERRINLHRYPVRIELNTDGTLTLEGEVADVAAKKIGLKLAAKVSGVAGIVDRLRVAPVERMGDGEIRDHVRDALLQDSALDTHEVIVRRNLRRDALGAPVPSVGAIEIAVEDGIVTLNGRVRSLARKRLAGALAWWVPGTRDVINGLEVDLPEDDDDDEITDVVRMVLEKDPLVEPSEIRVTTRNAVVSLEGLAASAQERRAAENDAWCVFGVDRVENRLELRE